MWHINYRNVNFQIWNIIRSLQQRFELNLFEKSENDENQ